MAIFHEKNILTSEDLTNFINAKLKEVKHLMPVASEIQTHTVMPGLELVTVSERLPRTLTKGILRAVGLWALQRSK